MKNATIIAQAIAAGVLAFGMVAQASATEATHTRVEAGSPAHGGTREGYRIVLVEKDPDATYQAASSDHFPPMVGGPMVGGTREGLHRHSIQFAGEADSSKRSESDEYSAVDVGQSKRTGTRG